MAKEPRFPGIDWYCDHCGALLSSQKGFDDHKYTWKCRKCGFKNSISWDNICTGDSMATQFLLHLLGLFSYAGLWTAIMLAVSMLAFGADRNIYFFPFLIFLSLYLFSLATTVVAQFVLRHARLSRKNVFRVLVMCIKEDVFAPSCT